MTLKLDDVNKTTNKKYALSEKRLAAKRLVELVKAEGISLVGPDGLLQDFTKDVVEIALEEEMHEHLGYEKNHVPEGEKPANIRNGTRTKTVSSSIVGEKLRLMFPGIIDSTFAPHIVKKRQRKLSGIDEIVLSLYAKGLTTGEISAHFHEIYQVSLSKESISRITDRVVVEMNEWMTRPLNNVYAAFFIDAIVVKIRDGHVLNKPIYVVIGLTLEGE